MRPAFSKNADQIEIRRLTPSDEPLLKKILIERPTLFKTSLTSFDLEARATYLANSLNDQENVFYYGYFKNDVLKLTLFGKKCKTIPFYFFGGLASNLEFSMIHALDQIVIEIVKTMEILNMYQFYSIAYMRPYALKEAQLGRIKSFDRKYSSYLSIYKTYTIGIDRIIPPQTRPNEQLLWDLMGQKTWDGYLYLAKGVAHQKKDPSP
jgi:hypothetical protein